MPREGGLGRGLASLIPQKKASDNVSSTSSNFKKNNSDFVSKDFSRKITSKKTNKKARVSKNIIMEIKADEIKANPFQPRQYFDEKKLQELAASIQKHGIIQPLIVTKRPEGGFELVAGERRFKASQKSGLTKIPVIIKKITDQEKLEWALIENIQRHDLNAVEEAEAYQGLIDKFNYTQEAVARQVGKSRSAVTNILRLLDLSINIKQKIRVGEISEGHARALLSLENKEQRERMLNEIIGSQLSVRETEKRIQKIKKPQANKNKSSTGKPEMLEFENKMSQALGTKVVIKKGKNGGSFIVNYYSEEEFGNLFNKLTS